MAFSKTVHQMREADTLQSLWDLSRTYLMRQGVERLSYHLTTAHLQPVKHVPAPRLFTWGFPQHWIDTYSDRSYGLLNPIAELALRRGTPFWWQDISAYSDLNDSQRAFIDELSHQQFGSGLAMGVFGPFLRNACIILYVRDRCQFEAPGRLPELHTVMQAAHFRYCELTAQDVPEFERLSQREKQVLQCIAVGKSKGVTAEFLGVSPHTVDTLVRRLFTKFSVSDRVSAVLLGVASGYVQTAGDRGVTRLRD